MRWSLGYELLFADFFPHCQDYAELLPGIYVRVRIEDAIDIEAIAVPAQGVQHTMASGNAVLSSMMPGGPRFSRPARLIEEELNGSANILSYESTGKGSGVRQEGLSICLGTTPTF